MTGRVDEVLRATAARMPDRVAVVDTTSGRRVTWAELDAEVDRIANGLNRIGMVAGYRVVLSLTNRVEFITTYLGTLRARLTAVPVNPRAATGELIRMLIDSGARMVVADETTVSSVREALSALQDASAGADKTPVPSNVLPLLTVVAAPPLPTEIGYDALLADDLATDSADDFADDVAEVAAVTDPESLAVLLYTSGTSGRPRAAMLSHRALVANIDQAAAVVPPMITAQDVVLGVLPLFHVYGLNAVLGQALRQGARLVLVDGFDPEGALALIEDEAVSVLPVAPPVFVHWSGRTDLRERLASVRLILSGSAPLAAERVAEFSERTGLEVHEGYGLTEAAPVVTSTLRSPRRKPGSVGSALPGIRIRLVDEDGEPPEGEDPGEIWICGDNLFSGYWPDGADGPDAQGWYATGDVGFLDAEGDLFLVDRIKDLIIVSGFNVYPSEVEEVIAELEGVSEAAVIGTSDRITGESVVAYVVPSASTALSEVALAQAVREHCAIRLARFKQPREVHVVPDLPHTGTGKVEKGRLRARRRDAELLQ